MNRESITVLLRKATEHTVSFARTMVIDKLPEKIGYRIRSERGIPQPEVLAESEVVDLVLNDAGVLSWVDLAVCGSDDIFTYISASIYRDIELLKKNPRYIIRKEWDHSESKAPHYRQTGSLWNSRGVLEYRNENHGAQPGTTDNFEDCPSRG